MVTQDFVSASSRRQCAALRKNGHSKNQLVTLAGMKMRGREWGWNPVITSATYYGADWFIVRPTGHCYGKDRFAPALRAKVAEALT